MNVGINNFHLFQSNDDKEKANSPFETNGLKKEDQTNGVVVIDDDKGFKWVEMKLAMLIDR